MKHSSKLIHVIPACIALAVGVLSSCGAIADRVAEEAAYELADDVRDHVVEATATSERPPESVAVLGEALHDVVDAEAADEDAGSFTPRYTGLADGDGDGLDDDGRVEIVVRDESACVIADDAEVTINDGPC